MDNESTRYIDGLPMMTEKIKQFLVTNNPDNIKLGLLLLQSLNKFTNTQMYSFLYEYMMNVYGQFHIYPLSWRMENGVISISPNKDFI